MPQQTTVSAAANTWTQITDANVTTITFQNISGDYMLVRATNGTTAPTALAGALRYNPGQGERNVALTDLAPGVSGANRVWVFAPSGAAVVVSHA
jgi:hypothetical protein